MAMKRQPRLSWRRCTRRHVLGLDPRIGQLDGGAGFFSQKVWSISPPERRALVDRDDPVLPVVAQCRLLKIARSTLYYRPAPVDPDDLTLMRRMDELYLASPFYGSRRMVAVLRRDGLAINRKRVRRLMRVMGLEAIYQKPNTSRGHPDHKVYPYLLRGLLIERPNQVWCADITYIPMARGFVYLVAVGAADARAADASRHIGSLREPIRHIGPLRGPMDWFSRRVLAWRLSITMDADFWVEALQEAIAGHGKPGIFNTDQGVQFTSAGFLDELAASGIQISMDGKGRFLDNIFIERLWRSLKYEEVFLKAYGSVPEARLGIGGWVSFYNDERPHQALGYRTPRAVFEGEASEPVDNAPARLGSLVVHRLTGTDSVL
jgi:putative transposase